MREQKQTETPSSVVGLVLAGGRSSRLGRDKARLALGAEKGAPDLLSRTAALLERTCGEVMIIGREHPGYAWRADDTPGQGPAGGIATALRATKRACLALACDLPFMEEAVLERLLLARASRPPEALVTACRQRESGRIEALVAVYEPGGLVFFERALAAGLRKTSLAIPPDRRHLVAYGPDEERFFFNINTPADLQAARRHVAGPPHIFLQPHGKISY